MPARLFALVPCAGSGARAGTDVPKQYHVLAGRPLVAHTLASLARVTRLQRTMVVLSRDDDRFERLCAGFAGDVARIGGASRAETVAAGLAELQARGARDDDWALVHDAARCLVQPAWIDALIDACIDDPVGGLLALPVADTLKRESNGRASGLLDRTGVWAAQTPQMFRIGPLRAALAHAGAVTDEAAAMQAMGQSPRLVRGSIENLKVTYPMDFELAERLLRSRA